MKYISHRGFIDGIDQSLENNPKQILYLLSKNVDVEIDITVKHYELTSMLKEV